jgi:7,8-dihydropterin-6-yl-methyl-4-(beta-D-ribofuranosyl)aminobenzene 5'-phosphate synthase
MVFGSAWPDATFKPLTETTEIAPGVWAIAAVSDAPGTRELRELSLAIRTDEGLLLVVGCSHPGLPAIVAAAAKIDADIHLVIGGFHYVNADDAAIQSLVGALDPYDIDFIAPGHCTGEATFAALQKAFGPRYLYAGVGAELVLDGKAPRERTGDAAAFDAHERVAYRALALRGDHAHDHRAALRR